MIQIEAAILGSILMDANIIDKVALVLDPIDFSVERHQIIYATALKMNDCGSIIDMVTLPEAMTPKELTLCGGWQYISEVAEKYVTSSIIDEHIQIIKNASTARKGSMVLKNIATKLEHAVSVGEEVSNIISSGQSELGDIIGNNSKTLYKTHELVIESYDKLKKLRESGDKFYIPTGITELDKYLGGGMHADFGIIAARPKVGKTALAATITANMAENGHCVGMIPLEPTHDEIMNRLVAMKADVSLLRFRSGSFDDQEWQRITHWHSKIDNWNLLIDDTRMGTPVEHIIRKCRSLKAHGAEIIFIDQLSKISGRGRTDTERYTYCCNKLCGLPKELGIPVILLCQINREAVKDKDIKKPTEAHLKQTGAIEEDCDFAILVHRDYVYTKDEKDKYIANIDLCLHRHGPTGDIPCRWYGKYARFED